MVFRGQVGGRSAVVSLKDTSVSLSVGDGWVAAWDAGGRLYSVWRAGHTYRRGLSGTVLHKWRSQPHGADPSGIRHRLRLDEGEANALVDQAAGQAAAAWDALRAAPGAWGGEGGSAPGDAVAEAVQRASRFDAASASDDARRFARVYRPIGILPPDQYLSVVVQATEGCSFGSCTFCSLYTDPFRVKTPSEFQTHVGEVRAYLGDSLGLRRRSVFLGAANALAVPIERLADLFRLVPAVVDGAAARICAFVDGFTGARKSVADYALLRTLGLYRVYVGVESGDDNLLAFVRKPATSEQAVGAVRAMKAGGLSVGVIVMVGLGGERFAETHVERTAAALTAMDLDERDLVFFSDLVELPGTAYPRHAARARLPPLGPAARLAQAQAIASRVAFRSAPPRFARYDVREFVY